MSLCLVASLKNEGDILEEFLRHYVRQGVAHFFLIDNGSTDNSSLLLQPHVERGLVTLVHDGQRHAQASLYNKYFKLAVKAAYTWVLVCDLDEFVYARKGHVDIPAYLATVSPEVMQIAIPWKLFGSNGLIVQPASVVDSFTRRSNYDKVANLQGVDRADTQNFSVCKCIARTSHLTHMGVHSHSTTFSHTISAADLQGLPALHRNSFSPTSESLLEESSLHLNHYCIQSLDWFMHVKATRGDGTSASLENVRDKSYFDAFDACTNDLEDTELKMLA